MPWDDAARLALACVIVGLALRTARSRVLVVAGATLRELALVLGLYSLWGLAGRLSLVQYTGAISRSRWIMHAERVMHLPSELAIQHAALPHSLFVQFCNIYYAIVHAPSIMVFLVWLFFRHRDHYSHWRNTLALLTGASLLIQLVPVAPPRFVPGAGFVDTPALYHQSVYDAIGSRVGDQLSAMPSVHVGWAVLIAAAVLTASTSRWRGLILAHPALTFLAIVVTGNHFWADGLVSIVLLFGAMWIASAGEAFVARFRAPHHSIDAVPAPVPVLAPAESGAQP